MWLDALDLINEIDTAVRAWQPDGDSTPSRLRSLASRKWRPQDSGGVEQIAGNPEAWVLKIESLLSPSPTKTISAPCPSCNAETVYRTDSGGERVRQPALQITVDGSVCMACRYTWGPERFLLLHRCWGTDSQMGCWSDLVGSGSSPPRLCRTAPIRRCCMGWSRAWSRPW